MSLIAFIPLNSKTTTLFFYILIIYICFLIPTYIDGIVPFDFDLFDSLGQVLICVPYFIWKIKREKQIFRKNLLQYSKLDYIIFALIIILNFLDMTLYVIYDDSLFYISELFNWSNLEIFILILLSKFSLNYRTYAHHVIGFIIMLLFAFINDYYLIKNDNEDLNYDLKHFIISLLDCILEAIILTYKKYLIDIKFISVYIVCFFFGAINLIYILILYAVQKIKSDIFCLDNNCLDVLSYENDFNSKLLLLFIIIISLICNIIFFFFYYKTIYLFTPSHTLLFFYLSSIITIFEKAHETDSSKKEWSIIILSILGTFFGLFIYLEIIELDFCGLNENTRRNINQRLGGSISSEILRLEGIIESGEKEEKKEDEENNNEEEDKKDEHNEKVQNNEKKQPKEKEKEKNNDIRLSQFSNASGNDASKKNMVEVRDGYLIKI